MINSSGIGTGLDVNSIVSQLMTIEQVPLVKLQAQKSNIDVKISAYGQLKGALSQLQASVNTLKSAKSFNQITATSSDTKIFTVSSSENAAVEKHSIEVINLAKQHRLASVAFAAETTEIGTGILTLTVNSKSLQLTIDASNKTLAGIRDAINKAIGNPGVAASIVNVDGGSKLVLTSNSTGTSNAVDVTVTNDGDGNNTDNVTGLSLLVYQASGTKNLSQLQAAENAELKVNTLSVTRSSNQISDVITGVTLTLKDKGTADLKLEKDLSFVEGAAKDLVSKYNAMITQIGKLRASSLPGENILLSIESEVQNAFSTKVQGNSLTLSDLGFSFDRQGVLSLNSSKLSSKLSSDSTVVTDLFTKEGSGFAVRLSERIDNYIKSGGSIKSRTDGLNSSIKTLNERIVAFDKRLQLKEERLISQFTALDKLLSGLQSTGNFVSQQLENLSFAGKK